MRRGSAGLRSSPRACNRPATHAPAHLCKLLLRDAQRAQQACAVDGHLVLARGQVKGGCQEDGARKVDARLLRRREPPHKAQLVL